jgi:phosphoglycolate phosphatase-like HAD superfamily hydrolase
MDKHKLIIFDMDGTLADRDSGGLLEGVADWFNKNRELYRFAIASNQGGVGLRQWMEQGNFGTPEKYPTEDDVYARAEKVRDAIGLDSSTPIYLALRYQSKKGEWSPLPVNHELSYKRRSDVEEDWLNTPYDKCWRKPDDGMIWIAMDFGDSPSDVLMVGDSPEDEQAAAKAGVDFQWAWDFFGRDKPE